MFRGKDTRASTAPEQGKGLVTHTHTHFVLMIPVPSLLLET
jgi:hypothetical protein